MFGMNGFGNPGDLMFLQSTVEKEEDNETNDFEAMEQVIENATEAFAQDWGRDLERCLDYGYEMADVFPDDFDDETNDKIYEIVKERYDDYFFN